MRKGSGKERQRSQRQLRVGEALRHALSDFLARRELRDPALEGRSVTVSEVRVSPDMRHATAFVSVLGDDDLDAVLDGGETPGGSPSTLVDVRGEKPILIREGEIPWEAVISSLR